MYLDVRDYLTEDRLIHTIKVVEKASLLADIFNFSIEDKSLILCAAEFHDIGYSDKISKVTNFHPLDGYLFLKGKVENVVSATVLLHSCSNQLVNYFEEEVKDLYNRELECLRRLKIINESYVTIVSMADMLIDGSGKECSPIERYNDVVKRYGKDDYRAKVMKIQVEKYV